MSLKATMRIVATAATVLLAAAILASTASARTLSTSSQTLRVTFARLRVTGVFGNIVCPATLEGTFHARTIPKVSETLVGLITAANQGVCAENQGILLRETLPWHLRYIAFKGTLPNITEIGLQIVGFAMRIREPLFTCLLVSEPGEPLVLGIARNVATRELTTARLLGLINTLCGLEARVESDAGPVTVLGAATRITLTLI
jgi:hypothetical protein